MVERSIIIHKKLVSNGIGGHDMEQQQMIEYVATCPVCGGYVIVFDAEAQDFSCTCCKRVWINGAVKIRGMYE